MDTGESSYLRIGELATRVGVSPELLRAWERRYGLLKPERSPGGFRLYSEADEARVRVMRSLLDRGVAAAEAARLALAGSPEEQEGPPLDGEVEELTQALDGFDDAAAHSVLDRIMAGYALDTVLRRVVLPYLDDLGSRWERGEVSVAQEHFASNLVRARLLNISRGWDMGFGPRALLACPEGELHDIALAAFGLALRTRGWRITFLGANTPTETVVGTSLRLKPDVVVLAATARDSFRGVADELRQLASSQRVVLSGRGADGDFAGSLGALYLNDDVVSAADKLAGLLVAP